MILISVIAMTSIGHQLIDKQLLSNHLICDMAKHYDGQPNVNV